MTDLIEVQTSTLAGAALDWAVAIVSQGKVYIYPDGGLCPPEGAVSLNDDDATLWVNSGGFHTNEQWAPSTDWSQGGPLICSHRMGFGIYPDGFFACVGLDDLSGSASGPSHLIAACRAIVAAKLGDTVQVPKELIP